MKTFKILLLITFLFSTTVLISQEVIEKKVQKGFLKIDYQSVKMIDALRQPEDNMGFAGIHYNLWLNNNIYGGAGFYGAVSGRRGGLFTLGVNLGAQYNFDSNFFIDGSVHFGAGGGASAPDGGGAMILPQINLGYTFNKFAITAGWSYINFFDKGLIKSHQANIAVQIPISFGYTSFKKREESYSLANSIQQWNKKPSRLSLMLHLNNLSPFNESKLTGGTSLKGKTIRLAGFELNSYLSPNWFLFFKADGAYDGIQGGYMDILLGGGYHFSFNKNRTAVLAKFGIGAGGGGGVDSAGGFFIYPDVSIEQKLFNNVFLAINKGFLMNPDAHFGSSTLGLGLKYYINSSEEENFTKAKIKGIEFILGQDVYFNANRYSQPIEHMYQLGLQANIYMNKNIYLTGETSFANFGNAGAYAEGIVGLGIRSNNFINNSVSVFIQGLAGAAGGGDISTGQGLIIKPGGGFYFDVNNKLSLRTEIGYVEARGGSLSSTYANIGLSYQLGALTYK